MLSEVPCFRRPQSLPAPHAVGAGPLPHQYTAAPMQNPGPRPLQAPGPLPAPQMNRPPGTLPPPPQAGIQDPRQMTQQPQAAPYDPRQQVTDHHRDIFVRICASLKAFVRILAFTTHAGWEGN